MKESHLKGETEALPGVQGAQLSQPGHVPDWLGVISKAGAGAITANKAVGSRPHRNQYLRQIKQINISASTLLE